MLLAARTVAYIFPGKTIALRHRFLYHFNFLILLTGVLSSGGITYIICLRIAVFARAATVLTCQARACGYNGGLYAPSPRRLPALPAFPAIADMNGMAARYIYTKAGDLGGRFAASVRR